jgi:hypothetical protein
MEQNNQLARAFGSARTPLAAPERAPSAVASVGDTVVFFTNTQPCTSLDQVQAVARYVGTNSVWFEDVASPAGTFSEAQFQELDDFYTGSVKPNQDSYFGQMSDIDANGRVIVLMTPAVNEAPGLRGRVNFADFFSTIDCATSNQAEIYYGMVPDPAGSVGTARTTEQVFGQYFSLLTHEFVHIIQYSWARFGGAALKTAWEAEGAATLAEQITAYGLFGHGSGQDLGWGELVAGQSWYAEWVNDLAYYFGFQGGGSPKVQGAPENCTWVGRESEGNSGPCVAINRAVYGVPSLLLRGMLDRFGASSPGGEAGVMRRLTQSPISGFASLRDISGRPVEQDLAEFYAALWGDGRIGDFGIMSTWNLFDISQNLLPEARLQPYETSAPGFQGAATVRAASSFYLHWTPSGAVAPTSLRVTSPSTLNTPSTLSVWVVRIQ